MINSKLEQIKQKLQLQKNELVELEASYEETSQPVELDQSKVGRLSRMDAMQGQQLALEAARRRQLQLKNIEAAFRRLESGEYGYCLDCGEEIDSRRLDFDPSNALCIGCAEKASI